MKQKFTMYVLNVQNDQWTLEGKEFEAELEGEGEYLERYDAPEFEVMFKSLLTRKYMPTQKWALARSKDMHKWLEDPHAVLEPGGVTATILFKDSPGWKEDEIFRVLKQKCLDVTRRELAGAETQMMKAVKRSDAANERKDSVLAAFEKMPMPGFDLFELFEGDK